MRNTYPNTGCVRCGAKCRACTCFPDCACASCAVAHEVAEIDDAADDAIAKAIENQKAKRG